MYTVQYAHSTSTSLHSTLGMPNEEDWPAGALVARASFLPPNRPAPNTFPSGLLQVVDRLDPNGFKLLNVCLRHSAFSNESSAFLALTACLMPYWPGLLSFGVVCNLIIPGPLTIEPDEAAYLLAGASHRLLHCEWDC